MGGTLITRLDYALDFSYGQVSKELARRPFYAERWRCLLCSTQ